MSSLLDMTLKHLNNCPDLDKEKLSLVVLCAITHVSYNKSKSKSKIPSGVSCAEVIEVIKSMTPTHALFKYKQPKNLQMAVTEATMILMLHGMVGVDPMNLEYAITPSAKGAIMAAHLIKEGNLIKDCRLITDYEQFKAEAVNAMNN